MVLFVLMWAPLIILITHADQWPLCIGVVVKLRIFGQGRPESNQQLTKSFLCSHSTPYEFSIIVEFVGGCQIFPKDKVSLYSLCYVFVSPRKPWNLELSSLQSLQCNLVHSWQVRALQMSRQKCHVFAWFTKNIQSNHFDLWFLEN